MSLTEIPRTPSVTSSRASLLFDFDVNDPDFGSLKDLPATCSAAYKLVEDSGLRKVKTCPVALGTLDENIENLLRLGSCGVNWQEDHISLDCVECGGYTFDRPCPTCDGECGATWKRDAASSHCLGKASWIGECTLAPNKKSDKSKKPLSTKNLST